MSIRDSDELHSVCHIAVISGPVLLRIYHGLGVWNDIAASSSSFLADCLACLVDEGYHLNLSRAFMLFQYSVL